MARSQSRIPEFVVAGAPKAATTTVHLWLSEHPNVCVPKVKETHHFVAEDLSPDTPEMSRARRYRSDAAYRSCFRKAQPGQLCGEVDPAYFSSPAAPARIHAMNPDARILLLLRHPMQRLISHYRMEVARGFETRPLPEILSDLRHPAGWLRYVGPSLYPKPIERYRKQFGADQVAVLVLEDFADQPDALAARVFEALGVVPRPVRQRKRRANEYLGRPRNRFFLRLVVLVLGAATLGRVPLQAIDPGPLQPWLFRKREPHDFTAAARKLRPILEAQIPELEALLGRDLGVWRAEQNYLRSI